MIEMKRVIPLVVGANVEFERSPYSPTISDYRRLCDIANMTNTQGRANIAEALILYGSDEVRTSRAMDNCFENNDGAKVRSIIEERAKLRPELAAMLPRIFG